MENFRYNKIFFLCVNIEIVLFCKTHKKLDACIGFSE